MLESCNVGEKEVGLGSGMFAKGRKGNRVAE